MPFPFYKQLDAMSACQPRLIYLLLGMISIKGRACGISRIKNLKNNIDAISLF